MVAGVAGGVARGAFDVRGGGLAGGARLAREAFRLGAGALGGVTDAVGGFARRALGGGPMALGLVARGIGDAARAVGESARVRRGGVGRGARGLLDAAAHLVGEVAAAGGGEAASAELAGPSRRLVRGLVARVVGVGWLVGHGASRVRAGRGG